VDSDKLSPAIANYLKTGVGLGEIVQTKGKGASISFKITNSQARGRIAAFSGQRYQKNILAKIKAKLAIKSALKLTSTVKTKKRPKKETQMNEVVHQVDLHRPF